MRSQSTQTNKFCFSKSRSIQQSALEFEELSGSRNQEVKRSERFEHILQCRCNDAISPITIFCSFAGIILGVLFTSTTTLWPQHNIIKHPEYWYEPIIPLVTGYPAAASGYIAYNYFYCLDLRLDNPWKILLSIYLVGMATSFILSCSCYLYTFSSIPIPDAFSRIFSWIKQLECYDDCKLVFMSLKMEKK